jgi:hypothetical protein
LINLILASFWAYDSWISGRNAARPLPELPILGSLRLREASQAKEGGHLMFNVTWTYDAMELSFQLWQSWLEFCGVPNFSINSFLQ